MTKQQYDEIMITLAALTDQVEQSETRILNRIDEAVEEVNEKIDTLEFEDHYPGVD